MRKGYIMARPFLVVWSTDTSHIHIYRQYDKFPGSGAFLDIGGFSRFASFPNCLTFGGDLHAAYAVRWYSMERPAAGMK